MDAPCHKKRWKLLRFLRFIKLHSKCSFYGGYGETGFNHRWREAQDTPAKQYGRVVLVAVGLKAFAADVAAGNPASAFDLNGSHRGRPCEVEAPLSRWMEPLT
jgi:hypothetical protein